MIEKLFKSREWDQESNTVFYVSDVVDMVTMLEELSEEAGLTLSRWEASGSGYQKTVSYAIHTGERTPKFSLLPEEDTVASVQFEGTEGATRRCKAYKSLVQLGRDAGLLD